MESIWSSTQDAGVGHPDETEKVGKENHKSKPGGCRSQKQIQWNRIGRYNQSVGDILQCITEDDDKM